jgi:hypothetical protein
MGIEPTSEAWEDADNGRCATISKRKPYPVESCFRLQWLDFLEDSLHRSSVQEKLTHQA